MRRNGTLGTRLLIELGPSRLIVVCDWPRAAPETFSLRSNSTRSISPRTQFSALSRVEHLFLRRKECTVESASVASTLQSISCKRKTRITTWLGYVCASQVQTESENFVEQALSGSGYSVCGSIAKQAARHVSCHVIVFVLASFLDRTWLSCAVIAAKHSLHLR